MRASIAAFAAAAAVLAGDGCAAGRPAAHAARGPRVLVLSAFDAELDALRRRAAIEGVEVVNGRSVYLGRLGGRPVALAASGVSIVNAAMTAEALLARLPVSAIVFSGIGGG